MKEASQDATLRLALGMWAADVRATITSAQRQWVIARLAPAADGPWRPFTAHEKTRIRAPLLAYMRAYHPKIIEIVTQQFAQEA